jgi:type IV secretory pathway VirB4 component
MDLEEGKSPGRLLNFKALKPSELITSKELSKLSKEKRTQKGWIFCRDPMASTLFQGMKGEIESDVH